MTKIYYTHLSTPMGKFLVAGTETAIHFTAFETSTHLNGPRTDWVRDSSPVQYATGLLSAYFDGEPVEFDVPLFIEGTDFQCRVWTALQKVTYGQTASYGEIAADVGSPGSSRAVGAANRANCLPVLIPCHRIIGADGSLTGFGGGLDTKAALLEMERPKNQFELF